MLSRNLLTTKELGFKEFDTTKPIRLIELFGGYGSQDFALEYLGLKPTQWKLCEWAVKSIQAYKDGHCYNDNTDYSKDLTKEQIIDYLTNKGISANYNEPMTYEQIKRMTESALRKVYNNIQSTHNLVNIQQVHGEDLEIVHTDKYNYVITYSYPCQDLSLAGKGAGMTKNSGTRSGMLWEFERILDELKLKNKELPQILLMENVPQVHGTKNVEDFKQWINKLHELGYTSYYMDLNAKNYSIPQNRERCFMISLLGNYHYKFPSPIVLKKRLKDLLEEKVDEKYYLSDKVISKLAINSPIPNDITGVDLNDTNSITRDVASTIKARYDCGYEHFSPGPTGVIEPQLEQIAKTKDGNNFNSVYSENGVSPTLLARDYKDPVRVATELEQVGQLYPGSGNPQAGRVYNKDGLSPCLDTCQGGNREVKICESGSYVGTFDYNKSETFMQGNNRLKQGAEIVNSILTTHADGVVINEPTICASRGRNPLNPKSRKAGEHLEQTIELGPDGVSNTLTTVQKDNYLVEPQCIEHDITTVVKVRKYPVDVEKLQDTLRERKDTLKLNNETISEKLNVPITNVEHWFRKDKYFSIPTPEIWYQLKELLEIETDEFDESITTFEEKLSEFDMSNRAYDESGLSPTLTTQGNSNIVESDLKRQLCNTLIDKGLVQEGNVIRHSYTKNRLDNGDKNLGRIESKENLSPTLDTRADTLGVVVNDEESLYTETEKQLFTEDGNIKRYLNSDIVDKFEEGQMATTTYPNGYGHGTRVHNESISLNTIDRPSVKHNLRIRKLTPKECFRLMGVKDEDYEKIAKNQSNASLYHLAGDSIVIPVLMAIFGELFKVDWKGKLWY